MTPLQIYGKLNLGMNAKKLWKIVSEKIAEYDVKFKSESYPDNANSGLTLLVIKALLSVTLSTKSRKTNIVFRVDSIHKNDSKDASHTRRRQDITR